MVILIVKLWHLSTEFCGVWQKLPYAIELTEFCGVWQKVALRHRTQYLNAKVWQMSAAQEAMWLQLLTSDLLNKSIRETTILEDNQSAICLAKSQQVHGRTKHIDIKISFHPWSGEGWIKLTYSASEDMVADMFTKGLTIKQFEKLRLLAEFTHWEREECWWF